MPLFRFSLKTAFILTTFAALCLGLWLHGYRAGISESYGHVKSKLGSGQLPALGQLIETSTSKSLPAAPRLPG